MIQVNKTEIDLGKVKLGQPNNFSYTLTNNGERTANVIEINPGCGSCTSAYFENPLLPGQSKDLKVVFTPKSTGYNIKTINLKTDQGGDSIRLSFKAWVE